MFPPDTIFAYADGFRLNWDIVGPKKQSRSLTSPEFGDTSLDSSDVGLTSSDMFNSYNHNGTACLQRAKCEAQFLGQPHDILTHLYLELFG
ncbi:hypothetical protein WDU94_010643 [Cyamophila willieti]